VDIASAPGILARARALPASRSRACSATSAPDPVAGAAAAGGGGPRRADPRLLAEGYPLRTIDIGGGLGINYEEGTGPDVAAFAAAVVPLLRDLGLRVLLEPGRSLVARRERC